MSAVVLDAGALIAVERRERAVHLLLGRLPGDTLLLVPSPVFAQVWRGSPRQALLAQLRKSSRVVFVPLDDDASLRIGALLAQSGTSDVVDAHVVDVARRSDARAVLTSDPDDLRHLDSDLRLVAV